MVKFYGILSKFREKSRRDSGAGGLLPVVVVGMLIIMAAASITGAVGFASKTSKAQRDLSEVTIENESLLQEFEAQAQSYAEYKSKLASGLPVTGLRSTAPKNYEGDDGKFQVYVSPSETQPEDIESAGVVEQTTSGWGNAKWVLVETTSKNDNGEFSENSSVAIYKAFNNLDDPTGVRSFYSVINTLEVGTHTTTPVTKTTINIKNGSTIDSVPGVTRNTMIADKGTGTGSANQIDWNVTDSTVHADFASRSAFLTMKNSKSYGDLRSLSGGISMTNNSVFYGNACSQFFSVNSGSERVGNATAGDCGTNYFKEDTYDSTRYVSDFNSGKIALVGPPANACTDFNALKAFVEGLTSPSAFNLNCSSVANDVLSNGTIKKELNLKTKVIIGFLGKGFNNLTINAANEDAHLILQAAQVAAVSITDTNFNAPTLLYSSSADTTMKNTSLVGQILVYNKKSRLTLDNSHLSYMPFDSKVSGGNVPMDLLRIA